MKIKKRVTQGVTSYSSWKLCLLHKLGLTGPLQAFYGGETDQKCWPQWLAEGLKFKIKLTKTS